MTQLIKFNRQFDCTMRCIYSVFDLIKANNRIHTVQMHVFTRRICFIIFFLSSFSQIPRFVLSASETRKEKNEMHQNLHFDTFEESDREFGWKKVYI